MDVAGLKAGRSRVAKTETYDAGEGVYGLHDWGGENIRLERGRRAAGGDTLCAVLAMSGAEVAGLRAAWLALGPRGYVLLV